MHLHGHHLVGDQEPEPEPEPSQDESQVNGYSDFVSRAIDQQMTHTSGQPLTAKWPDDAAQCKGIQGWTMNAGLACDTQSHGATQHGNRLFGPTRIDCPSTPIQINLIFNHSLHIFTNFHNWRPIKLPTHTSLRCERKQEHGE